MKKSALAQPALYGRVRDILDAARTGIARTVNTNQVLANWLVGREIVEEEQSGERRAGYGAKLLARLSWRLTRDYGRGYSVDNLEAFRQFYLDYPHLISETVLRKLVLPQISETVSRKSALAGITATPRPGRLHPDLSWSHYRCLLRVTRQAARDFYEIEAIRQTWPVRELSRQTSSLPFDRLAKSRDKAGVLRLASRGHEVMQPVDVTGDPVVIEFLGLPESCRHAGRTARAQHLRQPLSVAPADREAIAAGTETRAASVAACACRHNRSRQEEATVRKTMNLEQTPRAVGGRLNLREPQAESLRRLVAALAPGSSR